MPTRPADRQLLRCAAESRTRRAVAAPLLSSLRGVEDAFAAGDLFLLRQARLLEKRLFATCFLGAPPSGVVDALPGIRTRTAGSATGLEPDTRCPASLPIYVETAFQALATAGAVDGPMALARLRVPGPHRGRGGRPAGPSRSPSPIIEEFPRAGHWTEWTYEPGLNPTAGLVGLLYELGVEHPWRELAARYCWEQLEAGMPEGVHTLLEAFVFLEHVPERDRAEEHMAEIARHLEGFEGLHLDPETPGYGLSPLQFA